MEVIKRWFTALRNFFFGEKIPVKACGRKNSKKELSARDTINRWWGTR